MTDNGTDGDTILNVAGIGIGVGIAFALLIVAMAILGGPSAGPSIDAEWTLERVNESHAMIVHAGGEPVEGEHLVVTVDSYERGIDPAGVVVEGDELVFEARSDQVIRFYWDEGQTDGTLLGTWRPDRG